MASLSATMTSSSVMISAWDPRARCSPAGSSRLSARHRRGRHEVDPTTFAAGDPGAVRSVEVTVPSDGTWTLDYYVYDWDGNSQWYNQSLQARHDTAVTERSAADGYPMAGIGI